MSFVRALCAAVGLVAGVFGQYETATTSLGPVRIGSGKTVQTIAVTVGKVRATSHKPYQGWTDRMSNGSLKINSFPIHSGPTWAIVSLAVQQHDATQSKFMLTPGEPFPTEGDIPKGDVQPGGSVPYTMPSASTSSSSPASPSSDGRKLSGGVIAGIVIAAVFVAGLLVVLFLLLGRQKTMLKLMRHSYNSPSYAPATQYEPSPPIHFRRRAHMPTSHSVGAPMNGYETPEMQHYHENNFAPAPTYAGGSRKALPAAPGEMAELAGPSQETTRDLDATELAEKKSQKRRDRHSDASPAPGEGDTAQQRVASPDRAPSPSPWPMSFGERSTNTESA
ncbi:MAG: hypothetical protein Q9163_003586 [Psora crenata]